MKETLHFNNCIKTHAGGSFHPAQVGIHKAEVCIKTHLKTIPLFLLIREISALPTLL
jgi:hypothetical protein